jgi:hypothetical protein
MTRLCVVLAVTGVLTALSLILFATIRGGAPVTRCVPPLPPPAPTSPPWHTETWLKRCMSSKRWLRQLDDAQLKMRDLLERVGVRFWLGSANVFGAMRFNSVLPFDDDVDYEIFFDDFIAKRAAIERELKALKWTFDFRDPRRPENKNYLQVVYTNSIRSKFATPYIDVFLIQYCNETRMQPREYGRPSQLVIKDYHLEVSTPDHILVYMHEAWTAGVLGDVGGAPPRGRILVNGNSYPVARKLDDYMVGWYGAVAAKDLQFMLKGQAHNPRSLAANDGLTNKSVMEANMLFCVDSWRFLEVRQEPRALIFMMDYPSEVFGARFQANITRAWNLTCAPILRPDLADVVEYCKRTAPIQ